MGERPPGIRDADEESVERGYESRDIRIGPMVWLFAGFLAVVGLLGGGLWWLYIAEMSRSSASAVRPSAVTPSTMPADAPPLQPQVGHESLDAWDLQAMRAKENAAFAAMGWRQDDRTKRFAVPADIVDAVRNRQAASRPAEGER